MNKVEEAGTMMITIIGTTIMKMESCIKDGLYYQKGNTI